LLNQLKRSLPGDLIKFDMEYLISEPIEYLHSKQGHAYQFISRTRSDARLKNINASMMFSISHAIDYLSI